MKRVRDFPNDETPLYTKLAKKNDIQYINKETYSCAPVDDAYLNTRLFIRHVFLHKKIDLELTSKLQMYDGEECGRDIYSKVKIDGIFDECIEWLNRPYYPKYFISPEQIAIYHYVYWIFKTKLSKDIIRLILIKVLDLNPKDVFERVIQKAVRNIAYDKWSQEHKTRIAYFKLSNGHEIKLCWGQQLVEEMLKILFP